MTTNYNEIIKKLDTINPIRYAKDRNFINGSGPSTLDLKLAFNKLEYNDEASSTLF